MRDFRTILVTGGSGFIGSNFIRFLLGPGGFGGRVVNLDALTYAGNPGNLEGLEGEAGGSRYSFVEGDIRDRGTVDALFREWRPEALVHFAAESHVDRSIAGPEAFVATNVGGTACLLEAARAAWGGRKDVLFHHVSTDEVYGSLGETGLFSESSPYDPRSPYAASKAAADHLVRAWGHTYGLPFTVTNSSNNYGPRQHPEKLIPLLILNMAEGRTLPLYGDGKNVRDWIHVEDHARAIWEVMGRGETGGTWNVGGGHEARNLDIAGLLAEAMSRVTGRPKAALLGLVTFVPDRPGHDRRYATDSSKLRRELGWKPAIPFAEGLEATVRWYLDNPGWVEATRVRDADLKPGQGMT